MRTINNCEIESDILVTIAKYILLGVGLLFGGWVGAEALSRGPARLNIYSFQLYLC